jgi:C_GCAxxG_C_C family probable redox protein
MMTKKEVVNLAEEMAEEGFLCSEAVFKAAASAQGVSSELIPKIATGFAAGIGRSGEVCGAVSGAIMGLGLKYGRNILEETPPGRRPHWYATELVQAIRKRYGVASCAGVLGLDLNDPGDLETYYELDHWNTTCRELIRDSTALAWDLLQRDS